MSELEQRLRGRADFCRDRAEIKTPELLTEAADRISLLEAALRDLVEANIKRGPWDEPLGESEQTAEINKARTVLGACEHPPTE